MPLLVLYYSVCIINADTKGKMQKEKKEFTAKDSNDYFIKKVTKLNAVGVDRTLAIDPTKKLQEFQEGNDNWNKGKKLVLKTVQESKVRKIINQLKAKKKLRKRQY